MRLLFYVPMMAPYGGIERHVCTLAQAAAENGHQVQLITTSNSLGEELRGKLQHPNIKFRELPAARMKAGAVTKIGWLFRSSRAAPERPWDIIYTNGQSGLSRIVWQAAGSHTQIIHHHHNAADSAEQKTWSYFYREVLRHAHYLIGCSRATCTALNHALHRQDAAFLPYLTACPLENAQIVERAPSTPLKFGLCGRLIPEKGIETIVTLANDTELNDIEWHIHGAGEAYPPSFFRNKPRIIYHGAYRSASEHASALLGLDAAALFSTHNEGMPLSLIEGMSAGLPWIATDQGGTSELMEHQQNSVLVPASNRGREVVPHVRTLANRILQQKVSRRTQRAFYDRHFGPAMVSRRWLDFFADAVLTSAQGQTLNQTYRRGRG